MDSLDPTKHGGVNPLDTCESINMISMFDHEEVRTEEGVLREFFVLFRFERA